jgi:tetratricopeptide (TPR) repeat protein
MLTNSRLTLPFAVLTLFAAFPPPAAARAAEPGTQLENVELHTLAGGKAPLLSTKVRANVFVFFRTGQDRSADALRQLADCEKEFAGKPVYWAAIVSGSEPPAEVDAAVRQSGIKMPVLFDVGDKLYDKLGIRMHPIVGIADAKLKVVAMEPYRQVDYCEIIRAQIKVLLGEAEVAEVDKAKNPDASPLPGADPMMKAMRDVNMATKLYDMEMYAEALKAAQNALLVAPVAHAYTVMGQAYAKLGKCAEAKRAFASAAKLDPGEARLADATKLACR